MGKRLRLLRGLFAANKAKKRFEKEEKKAMSQSTITKPILSSSTTRNVAIGGISVGGATVGILAFLRRVLPDVVVWGPEDDIHILWIAQAIITPILSRLMAKVIDKK